MLGIIQERELTDWGSYSEKYGKCKQQVRSARDCGGTVQ
jgi:hypothetical protein